jgi:hypothetical protein
MATLGQVSVPVPLQCGQDTYEIPTAAVLYTRIVYRPVPYTAEAKHSAWLSVIVVVNDKRSNPAALAFSGSMLTASFMVQWFTIKIHFNEVGI